MVCETEKQKEARQLAVWAYLIDTLTPEQFKKLVMIGLGGETYALRERSK